LETSYLRLKAYPFTAGLAEFVHRHERVYVIDQNRDGQLVLLMRMELEPEEIGSCAAYGITGVCRWMRAR